ncbi:alpha/beta fold hydrolase [Idiomarina seosinensis]|uniref:alpha/beta fold hydrolase n=1 Tax=Idiomarina seosinensis TaxID=281739 RepID=UPI001F53F7E0|nr:alpha/beta fold hydrolase [Idiomarina seosinensis]
MIGYQQQHTDGDFRVVFLHGSGGGPDTSFMDFFTEQMIAFGAEVVRPDFPYWEKVRETGKTRPPNKMPVLVDAIDELLAMLQQDGKPLVLMGKSLGSRVMLRLADKHQASKLIALGFPFYPPQKPENSRLQELAMTSVSGLILQGTRDPFSKPLQAAKVELPNNWQLQWLDGADHSFAATKAKAANTAGLWRQAANAIKEFMQ